MHLACIPPRTIAAWASVVLYQHLTVQAAWGQGEGIRGKAGKSWPLCWLLATVVPWGGYISEPPDVFVMSTQRPSVVARGQERKGLHSTFCLCGVIVLQFKSGKEWGIDGRESAEGRIHLAWWALFVRFLKKMISLLACSSTRAVSSIAGCSEMTVPASFGRWRMKSVCLRSQGL